MQTTFAALGAVWAAIRPYVGEIVAFLMGLLIQRSKDNEERAEESAMAYKMRSDVDRGVDAMSDTAVGDELRDNWTVRR